MDTRLKAMLDDLRQGYEKIYGDRLRQLVLFGSHARGEARRASDVDVLVVLRSPVSPSEEISRCGAFKSEFCLKHDALVSSTYVSEDDYWRDTSPFLVNVRRDGVTV